jgi:hypothetical protein
LYLRIASSTTTTDDPFTAAPRAPAAASISVTTDEADRATLSLSLSGLHPGSTYVAHLHAGTPAQPAASTGVLGSITASADGTAQVNATSVRLGGAGASVELTGELLRDGQRFVDIHTEGAAEPVSVALLPVSDSQ